MAHSVLCVFCWLDLHGGLSCLDLSDSSFISMCIEVKQNDSQKLINQRSVCFVLILCSTDFYCVETWVYVSVRFYESWFKFLSSIGSTVATYKCFEKFSLQHFVFVILNSSASQTVGREPQGCRKAECRETSCFFPMVLNLLTVHYQY